MTLLTDTTLHPELQKQLLQLQKVAESIAAYEPYVATPPILDASIDAQDEERQNRSDTLPGLRPLLEATRRDIELIQKFLANPHAASLPPPSTNAPYLLAVWEEVLHAPQPVVAIGKTFMARSRGKQAEARPSRGHATLQPPGVKVDVVADNGRAWIRVNTTKNSRLLAEFREIDSYDTDSDDSLDVDRPSLAQTEFDNSILRMGRALLDAARDNPVLGTSQPPKITLRFTRLNPHPNTDEPTDPRIALTLNMLGDMGIYVQPGERKPCDPVQPTAPPSLPKKIHLAPTRCVNLDLSLLVALVSDLTHAPLPPTSADAPARFAPNAAYLEWKKSRLRARIVGEKTPNVDSDAAPEIENTEDVGKHSRALAEQLQQEMVRGLLQDMHDRLRALGVEGADAFRGVEFWTTEEARERCLRIVEKIGGAREKQRARALLGQRPSSSNTADEYWEQSRYPSDFIPLLPIHVFPASEPPSNPDAPTGDSGARAPFFGALERTCRALLAHETSSHPRPVPDELADTEIQRASVMKANPKLTAHTVRSVLWGAARGWTTMTANRASVKALVREVKKSGEEADGGDASEAAIWVVDPRSLAEGMRADYQG